MVVSLPFPALPCPVLLFPGRHCPSLPNPVAFLYPRQNPLFLYWINSLGGKYFSIILFAGIIHVSQIEETTD